MVLSQCCKKGGKEGGLVLVKCFVCRKEAVGLCEECFADSERETNERIEALEKRIETLQKAVDVLIKANGLKPPMPVEA